MIVQLFQKPEGVPTADENGVGRFDGGNGVIRLVDGTQLEAPGLERLLGGGGIRITISQSIGHEEYLKKVENQI